MNEIVQYEAYFPSEHVNEFVVGMGEVMNIPIDLAELEERTKNNGTPGETCVAIFRSPSDDNSFIVVDCCNVDYIYSMVIRCKSNNQYRIKSMFLDLVNDCRRRYMNQGLLSDLRNTYLDDNNGINQIKAYHGIDI